MADTLTLLSVASAIAAFGFGLLIWLRRESRALDRKYGVDPK